MGLDPNDLRLNIEAEVSAPGAQEAAAQIRAAGQAADETRARFDRLREAGGGTARGVEPVLPAFTVGAPPAPVAELPRVSVQQPPAPAPLAQPPPVRAAAPLAPAPIVQPAPAPIAPVQATPQANPFTLLTAPSPGATPLGMPDVVVHMQSLETQYAANDVRIEQLQNALDGIRGQKTERPPWATGMSDQGVQAVARHMDMNPHEPLWWEHIGKGDLMPETLGAFRRLGTQAESEAPQTQSAMRQEVERLKAEQARILEASGNITAAANEPVTFYRPPRPTEVALPWNDVVRPEPEAPRAVQRGPADEDRTRRVVDQANAPPSPAPRVETVAEQPAPARAAAPQLAAPPPPPPRPPAPPINPPAPEPEPEPERPRLLGSREIGFTPVDLAARAASNAAIDAERQRLAQSLSADKIRQLQSFGITLPGAGAATAEPATAAPAPERPRRTTTPRAAAPEVQETRRAVEGLDEPLQRAQRSAGGLAAQFGLSGQGLGRAALALTGVGVGLNAAVTVASKLHEEIAAAAKAQEDLALRTREVTAVFGRQQGPQILAQASAFTANPQTRGSEQDYLTAATALHGLSAEYGLNSQQIDRLIASAGTLARIHGTELGPAVQAVQGVLRGNVDSAQQYGIALTDAQGRIRGIGSTFEQLVGTVGRARAEQILYEQVLQQTASQEANAKGPIDSSANALDRLQKASELARQSLTRLAERPFNVAVNFLANLVSGFNQLGAPTPDAAQAAQLQHRAIGGAAIVAAPPTPVLPSTGGIHPAFNDAGLIAQATHTPTEPLRLVNPQSGAELSDEESKAVGQRLGTGLPPVPPDFARQVAASAAANRQVGESANTTTTALQAELSVFERISLKIQGDLIPTLQRLGSTQQAISGIGTIEQALRGPDALTGGDIGRRAAAQAAQDVLARQRQRDAQQPGVDAIVDQARQVDPLEFERRQAARAAQLQAGQAQAFAGRAQAEAQGQVATLDLVDRQRQLDAAGDLARLRGETLGREAGIVDLQRQEADLADRQRIAGRENLDLLEQQTRARLGSLDAANRLNDVQYAAQHDVTEIQAIRADVRRGALDPSALQRIPELRQEVRAERLATPRAEFEAQAAQRPADLAGRAVGRDQLNAALRQIPIEREQRGVEDQLTPLQQAQRLTDQRTQSINRQLELARLAEEPQRTAAERNVLAATAVALAADASVRSAEEWASGIHNGLTDLQRAWAILGDIPQAPPIIGPQPVAVPESTAPSTGPNPTPDRQDFSNLAVLAQASGPLSAEQQARAASVPTGLYREDLGQGGQAAGDTVTNSVTVHVNVGETAGLSHDQLGNLVAQKVLDSLNRQAARRSLRSTPRDLAGAR